MQPDRPCLAQLPDRNGTMHKPIKDHNVPQEPCPRARGSSENNLMASKAPARGQNRLGSTTRQDTQAGRQDCKRFTLDRFVSANKLYHTLPRAASTIWEQVW